MYHKRILFLVATIILCLFCSLSMKQKEPAGYAWGDTRNNVRLGASAFNAIQRLGKPILIRYQLRNNSKEFIRCYIQPSVELLSTTVWAGGRISVVTQNNIPLVCRRAVPFPDKGVDIAPGDIYENKIDLTQYFDFPGAGVYKASLMLRVHPSKDAGGKKEFGISSGEFEIILKEDKTSLPFKGRP